MSISARPLRRRGRRRRGARASRRRLGAPGGLRDVGAIRRLLSRRRDAVTPPTASSRRATTQTRYVFTNHGNTYLLRESNGKTSGRARSATRTAPPGSPPRPDFDVFALPPQGPTTARSRTRRATSRRCDAPAVIRSWQGADPFYAYVPFQRTAAGFDDNAATWLASSRRRPAWTSTGSPTPTRRARRPARRCRERGSYVPADATQIDEAPRGRSGQVQVAAVGRSRRSRRASRATGRCRGRGARDAARAR